MMVPNRILRTMMNRLSIAALTFVLTAALGFGIAVACDKEAETVTTGAPADPATLASVVLTVSDATCGGCVVPIRAELTALSGVKDVVGSEDDYHDVTVTYTSGMVTTEQMIAAVKKAGYTAAVKAEKKTS